MLHLTQPNEGGRGTSIVAGFVGAMAPNLLQVTTEAVAGNGPFLLAGQITFWLGAFVAAGLASALVYFSGARSPKRALTLGTAAPALWLGLANGLPAGSLGAAPPPTPIAVVNVDSTGSLDLPAPVDRVSRASRTVALSERRYVAIRGSGLQNASRLALVAVQDGAGNRKRYSFQESRTVLQLPQGTSALYVTADGAESNRVSIEAIREDVVTISVTVRVPAVRGFARAFGIRNAGALHVTLAVVNAAMGRPTAQAAGLGSYPTTSPRQTIRSCASAATASSAARSPWMSELGSVRIGISAPSGRPARYTTSSTPRLTATLAPAPSGPTRRGQPRMRTLIAET